MKIPTLLQVIPALGPGGVEQDTVDMAVSIKNTDSSLPTFVASAGGERIEALTQAKVDHITLPLASKNPLQIIRNAYSLAKIIRQYQIQVVHARSRAPAWSALWAARMTGVPLVTTFHGTYGSKNTVKRWYNSVMLKGNRVIAISQFIVNHIINTYAVNPKRIELIYDGIDLKKFSPTQVEEERIQALRTAWRIAPDQTVILLPGRLTRWKGQTIFLQALAALKNHNVVGVLLGSDQGRTGYRQELQFLVAELGITPRFIENCQDMPAAYALADIVVSASIEPEAFGRVVGEAAAMERIIIAPNHGAAPEMCLHEKTGFLYAPGDFAALTKSLESALSLPKPAKETIQLAARSHIAALFDWDKLFLQTVNLYQNVYATHSRY